jgi:hypothetical protein
MYYLLKMQVGLLFTILEFPCSIKKAFFGLEYVDNPSQHEKGLIAQENCYTIR